MSSDRTYGNIVKPRTAGYGSLSRRTTVVVGVGLLGFAVLFPISSKVGLIYGAVVAVLVVPLKEDRFGVSAYGRMGDALLWRRQVARRGHVVTAGPLSRTPDVTFRLPGLAARMSVFEANDAYGEPFAVVHHPRTGHASIVLQVEPQGKDLIDQDVIDQRVGTWGAWLASAGHEDSIAGIGVIVETRPDAGVALRNTVHRRLRDDAPPLALAVMREVVENAPAAGASTSQWVTVTFRQRIGGLRQRSDLSEVAQNIGRLLPSLCATLVETGAGRARALRSSELALTIAAAFRPEMTEAFEEAAAVDDVEFPWSEAGPTAAEGAYGKYRHDGAQSMSWVMARAPMGVFRFNVLEPLLRPHPEVDVKRVALLYRPHGAEETARLAEEARDMAAFHGSQDKRVKARNAREMRQAEQSANEESEGAGLVRFGMIVTATVIDRGSVRSTSEALDRAAHVVTHNLATPAQVRLRPAYASQPTTFLGGLPLGLVLPDHVKAGRAVPW